MKTVCAWCQTTIRPGAGPVSHGICEKCALEKFGVQIEVPSDEEIREWFALHYGGEGATDEQGRCLHYHQGADYRDYADSADSRIRRCLTCRKEWTVRIEVWADPYEQLDRQEAKEEMHREAAADLKWMDTRSADREGKK